MNVRIFLIIVTILVFVFKANAEEYAGFKVKGRFLYDNCGEKVILRGVSNPNIWFEHNGLPQMTEIKKTGANVVRIVWQKWGDPKELDEAIMNCIDHDMIAMVELHDATGDFAKLQSCVDYWIRNDVVDVLQSHEEYLLVNIANEPGDYNVSKTNFRSSYQSAIEQMRSAGIHVPLVIDGTDWGKNINIMQSEGPALIESDPDQNLIFSVHMWWPKMYGFTEQMIINEIAESVKMGLPLIVGEFSQMHGAENELKITSENSIPYKTIIRECEKTETGYISWSWFGNSNPNWDMTTNGTFESLYDWGLEVAVTDENSIKNTSVRPYSILNDGACKSTVGFPVFRNQSLNEFDLSQNYPNPVVNESTIEYNLSKKGEVQLVVYDINGKKVKQIVNEEQVKGSYQVLFNTEMLENGIYFYTLSVNGCSTTKKILKVSSNL